MHCEKLSKELYRLIFSFMLQNVYPKLVKVYHVTHHKRNAQMLCRHVVLIFPLVESFNETFCHVHLHLDYFPKPSDEKFTIDRLNRELIKVCAMWFQRLSESLWPALRKSSMTSAILLDEHRSSRGRAKIEFWSKVLNHLLLRAETAARTLKTIVPCCRVVATLRCSLYHVWNGSLGMGLVLLAMLLVGAKYRTQSFLLYLDANLEFKRS